MPMRFFVIFDLPDVAIPCKTIAKIAISNDIILSSDDIEIGYPGGIVSKEPKTIRLDDINVNDIVDAYDVGNMWIIKAWIIYPFSGKIQDTYLGIPSECMELYIC